MLVTDDVDDDDDDDDDDNDYGDDDNDDDGVHQFDVSPDRACIDPWTVHRQMVGSG